MPGKGIRNAVYKRAGGKGQSSKFYNIYGQVVKPSDPTGFKGGQGWTAPKPQIGSMLSLGIMKQNKNAGGNNVCQPGPKPKKSSTSNDSTLTLVPSKVASAGNFTYGFAIPTATNQGGFLSPQSLPNVPGTQINEIIYNGFSEYFVLSIDFAGTGGAAPAAATDAFSTVSFINSDDGTGILYNSNYLNAASFPAAGYSVSGTTGTWNWQNNPVNPAVSAEKAFWEAAVGKNIKVGFAPANTIVAGGTTGQTFVTGTFGDNNNDCECRGPLAQCPCRKGGC